MSLILLNNSKIVLDHRQTILDQDIIVLAFDDLLFKGTVLFLLHYDFETKGFIGIL